MEMFKLGMFPFTMASHPFALHERDFCTINILACQNMTGIRVLSTIKMFQH